MGVTEEAGKLAGGVVDAMKGVPMLLAMLLVNLGFLGIIVYFMGEAAANAGKRNEQQLSLIERLVTDIRDCRQGPRPQVYDPLTKSLIRTAP